MPEILRGRFKSLELSYESPERMAFPDRHLCIEGYLDKPREHPMDHMVFGHVFPVQYLGAMDSSTEDIFLATFLRDPLERLLSHYRYWKGIKCYPEHYLWQKVQSEEWSFERFALSKEMRNYYCQYFAFMPFSRIDFAGIFEDLANSWHSLCKTLQLPQPYPQLPHLNQTKPCPADIAISNETRSEIIDFHAQDYHLYNSAKRCNFGPFTEWTCSSYDVPQTSLENASGRSLTTNTRLVQALPKPLAPQRRSKKFKRPTCSPLA